MKVYNIDGKFMYEILDDYKDAKTKEEKENIFNSFCSAIWKSNNRRKVYQKEINFKVKEDLLITEVGKIFEKYSKINYTAYYSMTKNKDYLNLIRQKINNIYTNLFDKKVCLKKVLNDMCSIEKLKKFAELCNKNN